MFVLLLTVFVDLVGFGIILPILPFYAQAYGATAVEITLLVSTYSAVQIVSAPIWGRLSDRYGRKLILLATGKSKAWAVAQTVEGPVSSMVTASALQMHRDAKVIVDEDAAGELKMREYYEFIYKAKIGAPKH